MRLFGKTRAFRSLITEPEPGRVLVETDLASTAKTTFLVQPIEGGLHSHVTITTELKTRLGLPGLLEGFLANTMLKRVYTRELELLANRAKA